MPSNADCFFAPAEPPPPAHCDCLRCGLTLDTWESHLDEVWDGYVCADCLAFGGSMEHGDLWRKQCEECGEWTRPELLVETITEDLICPEHPTWAHQRAANSVLSDLLAAFNTITTLDALSAEVLASMCGDHKRAAWADKPNTPASAVWVVLDTVAKHHAAMLNRPQQDEELLGRVGWEGISHE